MPELADTIAAVSKAVAELRVSEDALELSRGRFAKALRDAHEAGASYGLLGRVVGLSRQRVARIVAED
jgi:hypothetical protein